MRELLELPTWYLISSTVLVVGGGLCLCRRLEKALTGQLYKQLDDIDKEGKS